ncbi:cytochrome-c oxidase subunit VIIa [Phellopilus nigrolimitatus]|nr:cytochrome-c oxidase subunit VIIa [Phellopilus nigrolimitatus]
MPVAPITGTLRKRFFTDLSLALGLGFASGYAYWYGFHLPGVKRHEEYYLKLEKARQEDSA